MGALVHDVLYAARSLKRHPSGFLLAAAVLALSLGVNTGLFSVVNAVLLRPLPAGAAHELRYVHPIDRAAPGGRTPVLSYADFRYIRQGGEIFSEVFARSVDQATARFGDYAAAVTGEIVTTNYFQVLAVAARLGRTFDANDQSAGLPVAVISYDLWLERFGGRPDVLGQTLALDPAMYQASYGAFTEYTVIGVMGPGFRGTLGPWRRAQYWVPWARRVLDLRDEEPEPERTIPVTVIGRLKPGVSDEHAEAMVRTIGRRIQLDLHPTRPLWELTLRRSRSSAVPFDPTGRVNPARLAAALLLLSGLVFAIALVNLTGSIAVDAVAGEGERAVRLALGASPARLARQGFIRGLLVAAAGGCCALAVGRGVASAILLAMPPEVGRWEVSRVSVDAPVDLRVLLFTSGLTLASGVVMGWLASRVGRRRPLMEVLQRRCAGAGRATGRALRAVVALQMAGSIPLAILAVSFATAFLEAEWRDVGYASEGVVLVQFLLPRPDVSEGRESSAVDPVAVAQRIVARYKERYPDEAVAATDAPPFRHTGVGVVSRSGSRSGGQDSPPLRASTTAVSADYFAVLRVRVLQGRTLQDGDASATSPGVVVSASLARTLWPAADPVGQVLSFASVRRGQHPTWMQVVGVVADVRPPDAAEGGMLMVYTPLGLMPWAAPSVVLARGRGPQAEVLSRLTETVIGSHQRVMVGAATTLNARLGPLSYVGRVSTTLLGALAALAVGLTTLGVSGLAVFWIAQRRGQAAIRLALGARPGDIGWLAAREGLTAALAGTGIGLLLTYPAVILATRWAVVAPQVRLVALVAVPVLLGLSVLAACYPAARLARRLDPLVILRMP